MHGEPSPGQVIVADVHSNGPAADLLQPGDRLIACDDVLLSMEAPDEHLETLLAQTPPGQPVRMRVVEMGERHGRAAILASVQYLMDQGF